MSDLIYSFTNKILCGFGRSAKLNRSPVVFIRWIVDRWIGGSQFLAGKMQQLTILGIPLFERQRILRVWREDFKQQLYVTNLFTILQLNATSLFRHGERRSELVFLNLLNNNETKIQI